MARDVDREVAKQQHYYERTAGEYDELHGDHPEHGFALGLLAGIVGHIGAESVLDVGAGTGRAMRFLRDTNPQLMVRGIEPIAALRRAAISRYGIPAADIQPGDVQDLSLDAGSFDLLCAFGVMHHVPDPNTAIDEMLRVARLGVFISDSNSFGQGSPLARLAKQSLNSLRLWPLANLIKTRGRGYSVTEGDGLAYSYSVFGGYKQLQSRCKAVHTFNTVASGRNHYRSASHVALLALKG